MKSILKPLLMIAAMALGMTAVATLPARALVEINVNKGNVEPLPIAITDFQGGDALGAQISADRHRRPEALRPVRADRQERLHREDRQPGRGSRASTTGR